MVQPRSASWVHCSSFAATAPSLLQGGNSPRASPGASWGTWRATVWYLKRCCGEGCKVPQSKSPPVDTASPRHSRAEQDSCRRGTSRSGGRPPCSGLDVRRMLSSSPCVSETGNPYPERLCNTPKATQRRMVCPKFKSRGPIPGSGMASQKQRPRRWKAESCLPAGWLRKQQHWQQEA